MTGKRRVVAGVVVVALVAAAYAVWPREPELVWYTTPELSQHNVDVRLRFLAPRGWIASAPEHSGGETSTTEDDFVFIKVAPPTPLTWLPERLRHRLFGPPEYRMQIEVLAFWNRGPPDGKIEVGTYSVRGGQVLWAVRGFDLPVPCSIAYGRLNLAKFEATYRQICGSLKVVRQP
jgi:hypothetical protein